MRQSIILMLLSLLIIYSCENTIDDSRTTESPLIVDTIESILIVDSIKNFHYGAEIYFSIEATDGIAPYHCEWINPDSLEGLGPHMIIANVDVPIKVIIMDSSNSLPDTLITTIDIKRDYRDKYIGKFYFEGYYCSRTIPESWYSCYTYGYYSVIEKYGSNRLRITFNRNTREPEYNTTVPTGIYGLIYPIIDESGIFTYPEVQNVSQTYFRGGFHSNDSLYFEFGIDAHAGSQKVEVIGTRISE